MLNEILAGILAGSGWLIGILLYRLTRDELDPWAKKFRAKFKGVVFATFILAAFLSYTPLIWVFILVFAVSLFISSIYGVNKKPRHQVLAFVIHVIVFLAAVLVKQLYL